MAGLDVDAGLVRRLAELLDETGLSEIEYEADGRRIRVVRTPAAGRPPAAAPALPAAPVPPAGPTPPAAPAAEGDAPPGAVTSPMVGTVYLTPAPKEPPFVRVGDTVAEGQTLMFVEAMKTYNEIRAPRAGVLSDVLVGNGQPVEFGETLAVIT